VTLIYEPDLEIVKIHLHTKNKAHEAILPQSLSVYLLLQSAHNLGLFIVDITHWSLLQPMLNIPIFSVSILLLCFFPGHANFL